MLRWRVGARCVGLAGEVHGFLTHGVWGRKCSGVLQEGAEGSPAFLEDSSSGTAEASSWKPRSWACWCLASSHALWTHSVLEKDLGPG